MDDQQLDGVRQVSSTSRPQTGPSDSPKGVESGPQRGSLITFGPCAWRVLSVQTDTVLTVSETALETRPYNAEYRDVTWAECSLRRYLNDEFYDRFTPAEKALIVETGLANNDNPWLGTMGGTETTDKIFLPSLGEVVSYFGDSGQLRNKNPNSVHWINDRYNLGRIARDDNGTPVWWWLRTPGIRGRCAAYVNIGGSINLAGHYVNNAYGAVRPASYMRTSNGSDDV